VINLVFCGPDRRRLFVTGTIVKSRPTFTPPGYRQSRKVAFLLAQYPPSTGIVTRLINFEAKNARKSAVPARSLGSAHSPPGIRATP
jgi:hypothetical protein